VTITDTKTGKQGHMPSGNGEKKKTKVVSKEKHLAKNFQRLPNVKNFPFFHE
jgi:hypothetical protein